jgi:hypothetical protein
MAQITYQNSSHITPCSAYQLGYKYFLPEEAAATQTQLFVIIINNNNNNTTSSAELL